MRFLENMKVGSKIVFLAVVLLIFMALNAWLGVWSANTLNTQLNLLYSEDLQGVSAAKEANIQFLSASRALRNMALYVAKKDSAATRQYEANYERFTKAMWQELEKAGKHALSAAGKKIHADTVAAVRKSEALQRENIKRVKDGVEFAPLIEAITAARPDENKAGDMMTELMKSMDAEGHQRSIGTNALYDRSLYLSLGLFALALLLGLLLSLLIRRAIAAPLISVADKATRVAGGDLNQEFNFQRSDEIGVLSTALEKMVVNLRARIAEAEQKSREAEAQSKKAMQAMNEAQAAKDKAEAGQRAILHAAENVEQVVNRLSAATEELSAQVEESSRGTDIQRDRVSSSATAMEEMNSTVLEVARNAGVASEGSERARSKARTGEDIVRQSIKAIGDVQHDTLELKKNMEDLGRQAESIGTIMTVISDIADQTNLLALNAAIEAARAGEAGRGFAVVADEVRKLAEKTMTATKQVGDAIRGIQSGTRQSITAVERTTGNLDSATGLVKRSGESLAEIVQESVQTADQVRNIATASEEQSAASEEITHSLEEINRMAGETASAMQQSAQAVSDLASQSQELQRLVNKLREG